MSLILGLNAYHGDSSACLVRDGKLVAAAEEERFRRIKHWAGLPAEAIRYCLEAAGADIKDVDQIAMNRQPRIHTLRRIAYVLRHRPAPALLLTKIRNIGRAAKLQDLLSAEFKGAITAQFHHVEHHLAHLASAFLVSPYKQAVAVSIDAMGDFSSAAWGPAERDRIQIDGRVFSPHSLGIFYSAITQHIGFPHFGDEYKVMGLAPYGEPKYMEEMRKIVHIQRDGSFRLNLDYFRHHREDIAYRWDGCSPEVGTLYSSALETLLGPSRKQGEPLEQKHKDLARSAQQCYEDAFFALLTKLHEKYQQSALVLAGGCAMNSVANGKVYRKSPFKTMYLPAAAGDAGGAIGAAFVVWHQLNQNAPRYHMDHAFWGPESSDGAIRELLQKNSAQIQADGCRVQEFQDLDRLCLETARGISEGKVIGWFQGRMEWGPRALGNRSILGDPRRADMKDILNQKIKRRESFRPFAPSILREAVPDWFETDDDVPFMMQVFQVREERRKTIPAVTHVDGSGRLQTVYRDTNPRYYRLIEQFAALTGVPIVLNTSFNENEPVVCRPEEALDCFLRTKMDLLVLGNWLLRRN